MKITSLALTEYVFLNITSYYQELFAAIIADENLRIIHKKKKNENDGMILSVKFGGGKNVFAWLFAIELQQKFEKRA